MIFRQYTPDLNLAGKIVVDGNSCGAGLQLSHWPGNATPAELKADLSLEIVLRLLASPAAPCFLNLELVTNDHYDTDGLLAIWALLNPATAPEHAPALRAAAAAGDFYEFTSPEAVQFDLIARAFESPEKSPLAPQIADMPDFQRWQAATEALLSEMPGLLSVRISSGRAVRNSASRAFTRSTTSTVLVPDCFLTVIVDQSRFIKASYEEVKLHLILGALLVALTLYLFMHDWRSTLIASVAIPASIVSTFTLMRTMGFTLNNITMLGLILAVGIVIDDAVVVLENIFRHVEENNEPPLSAASTATREIALAVMATTLSLLVIFMPLAFMAGRAGRFFSSFGVTVAFAVAVSLLISFTLTPMLSSRFLKVGHKQKKSRQSRLYSVIDRSYAQMLFWSLGHRWVVMAAGALTIIAIVPLFRMIGKNFIPTDDQSEFEIIIQMPGGATLPESDRVMREIEPKVRALRGVTNILTTIGDTTGNVKPGQGDVTIGDMYVRLTDLLRRHFSQFDVMADARRLLQDYPDLRVSVQGVNSFTGGGTRQTDLEFNLRGPSLDKLQRYSDEIMRRMRAVPGIVDADTTLSVRQPELRAIIDRKKASEFGIEIADVAETLRAFVGGEPVSKFKEEADEYDIWLRATDRTRADPAAIANLTVPARDGRVVKIANLAELREDLGPSQIDRYNRQRKVTVVANLLESLPLGQAVEKIQQFVRELDLPPAYTADFTGRAKVLGETMSGFAMAFALSFVFMYMVLAAQFESFTHPIAILLALPLTLPFAILSLLLLRQPLDIYAMFGLFMLFGIVKKNGILQIDYTNTLRAQGLGVREAVMAANRARLRPILMTTLMLVFGMLPMALGHGPGAASRASMAKVIIGGQALSLLITPVAYSLFDELAQQGVEARWGAVAALFWKNRWSRAGQIYQRDNSIGKRK